MAEKIVVQSGVTETICRLVDPEDGDVSYRHDPCYGVCFSTAYGIEYTHRFTFPFTPDGERRAARLAARAQAKIDRHGVAALDGDAWATRTMYGTQAYLDEEPAIVAREREDALFD